jgi:hypothetical protein
MGVITGILRLPLDATIMHSIAEACQPIEVGEDTAHF